MAGSIPYLMNLDTKSILIYHEINLPNLNLSLPSFSRKKLLLLGFLFVMLLAIPATVFLVKQQQDLITRAVANTTLSLTPAEKTASVGDEVTFDIFVSPGNNQVSFIKLVLKFDPEILSTTEDGFTVDPLSNLSIIQGPVVGTDELSVVLTVQADPTKVIQTNTKIGTVAFDVIAPSDLPTQISFDQTQIQISSIAAPDSFTENVFLNGTPANITILGDADLSPTPSATPSATPSPTITDDPEATESPTPTPTDSLSSDNEVPVCDLLTTDFGTSGVTPYTLIFTAEGSDFDGTIQKVTFDFGDTTIEDLTEGGGIGTSTVSVENTHTYESSGTFNASVIFTDDLDGVSDSDSCSLDIDVSGGDTEATISATPTPTIADPGPREAIVGIGVLGAILFIIGTLLFFAL